MADEPTNVVLLHPEPEVLPDDDPYLVLARGCFDRLTLAPQFRVTYWVEGRVTEERWDGAQWVDDEEPDDEPE